MTTGGTARSFVFNYLFRFPALAIVRQGGSDLRYYVHLPDGRLLYSIEANNTRHYYHFDEMGNTVLLTGDTGAATDSYAITPYGDIADHSGTTDNPFTWQGQYGAFQEGTALYNLRYRHYDASAARFVSRDSALSNDPRSSEPYAYGNGNPLLFVDPFGTDSLAGDVVNFVVFIGNTIGSGVSTVIHAASSVVTTVYHATSNFISGPAPEYDPSLDASGQAAVPFQAPPTAAVLPPSVLIGAPALTQPAPAVQQPVAGKSTPQKLKKSNGSNGSGSLIGNDGSSLIGNDGSSLIGNDGSSLIGNDGSSLIGNDGSSAPKQGDGVVSNDGGSMIGNDGSSMISQDGSGLAGHATEKIARKNPSKSRLGSTVKSAK